MSAEQKPTPGPWKAEPNKKNNGSEWLVTAGPYFICAYGFHGEQDTEAEANARLIAAAPAFAMVVERIPGDVLRRILAELPTWVDAALGAAVPGTSRDVQEVAPEGARDCPEPSENRS